MTHDGEIRQAIDELLAARRNAAAVIAQAIEHVNAAHRRLADALAHPPTIGGVGRISGGEAGGP